MSRDVFISYSRKNMAQVMEIKNQIDRTCGTECWIDLKGIESGSEMFLRDIVGGIDACKVFLFMLSRESMESEYALLELNYAKEQGKRVVLVNIDDCRMNGVFLFKYSLTDTIAWNNPPQREKLLRDVARWIGGNVAEPKDELLLPVERGGKWGFANLNGDIVIPCQWKSAGYFSEGLARVRDSSDKVGFIDITGRNVIPCQWDDTHPFCEGRAMVRDSNGKYGFIDNSGRIIIPCQWEWGRATISEGLAGVADNNGKWGFIDKNGRIVIPCQWKCANSFNEGLAPVEDSNGKWGFIDKNDRIVIPCQWKNAFSFNDGLEGLAEVQDSNGKCGFIDKSGRNVIPCQWEHVAPFIERVAKVKDSNGKVAYIDKTGRIVLWRTE